MFTSFSILSFGFLNFLKRNTQKFMPRTENSKKLHKKKTSGLVPEVATAGFPVGTVAGDGLFVRAVKLVLVELKCLLFGSLGGVGHVTFVWFFHTINSAGRATSDKHLAEEAASVLVVKAIDGEYLAAIHVGQAKY